MWFERGWAVLCRRVCVILLLITTHQRTLFNDVRVAPFWWLHHVRNLYVLTLYKFTLTLRVFSYRLLHPLGFGRISHSRVLTATQSYVLLSSWLRLIQAVASSSSSSSCSPVNPMVTMRLKCDVSVLVCHVWCPSLPACSIVNDSSPLVYYWSTSCMDDLCCVFPVIVQ